MKLSTPTIDPAHIQKQDIRTLFTNITPRYDLLNTLLSFQLDTYWRNAAVEAGLKECPKKILDIGTGTGKLLGAFLKKAKFERACGIDLCESMLEKARHDLNSNSSFICTDSTTLPFKEKSFDLVVSSFTMRSIPSLDHFFGEIFRVLIPGGKMIMLELTRPRSLWLRAAYYPYLHFYLPFLGWLISRDVHAYRFLADSISTFKDEGELKRTISSVGFSEAEAVSLSLGLATILMARRPLR